MKKLLSIICVGFFICGCEDIRTTNSRIKKIQELRNTIKDTVNHFQRMISRKDSIVYDKTEQIANLKKKISNLKKNSSSGSGNYTIPDTYSEPEKFSLNDSHPNWTKERGICEKYMVSGRKKVECFYIGVGNHRYTSKKIIYRDDILNSKELVEWYSQDGKLIREDVYDQIGMLLYTVPH